MDYKQVLKFYPNFPIHGVNFVDIIPFLQDKEIFKALIDDIGRTCASPNILAPEARGFPVHGAPPVQRHGGECHSGAQEGETALLRG